MDEYTNKILDGVLNIKLYEFNLKENKIDKEEYINLLNIKIAYQNIKKTIPKTEKNARLHTICKYYYDVLTVDMNHVAISNTLDMEEILFIITSLELLMDLNVSFPKVANKMYEKTKSRENKKVIEYGLNK